MASKTGKLWRYPLRTLIGTWVVVSAITSIMGPFGTFPRLALSERFVFWGTVIGLAIVMVVVLRIIVLQFMGKGRHPFLVDAVLLPPFVLLFTPPLQFLISQVSRDQEPFGIVVTGLIVILVSLVMIAVREILNVHAPGVDPQAALVFGDLKLNPAPALVTEPSEPVKPVLLERLPDELQGALWAVSGSDHYVDVHTDLGQASVLLRFSDALREVDCVPGLRVHRSHWVADEAVSHIRREGNRHFVVLRTGRELPVSRTYSKTAFGRWGDPCESLSSP